MLNKKIDLNNFYFEQFKKEAIDRLKSGESLTGKEGILTPLLKEIFEAALEGEMDAHLSEYREDGERSFKCVSMNYLSPKFKRPSK